MAQDINQVCVTGNVTEDARLTQTNSGMAILKISIANNKAKKKQGDQYVDQPPNYLNIVLFGNYATSMAVYIKKGVPIAVNGRLSQSSYQLQEESKKRTKIEIIADSIRLFGSKQNGQQQQNSQTQQTQNYDEGNQDNGNPFVDNGGGGEPDDEIPF